MVQPKQIGLDVPQEAREEMEEARQSCLDIPQEVQAAMEEATADSCEKTLCELECIARSSLAQAGLPNKQGAYLVIDETDPEPEEQPEEIGLLEFVKQRGYDDCSPEYFAAQVLTLAQAVRLLCDSGQTDAAVNAALQLGRIEALDEYSWMVEIGSNAWSAGQKAARATWGSEAERAAKNDEIRRVFEEERPNCPTIEDAYAAVAKRLELTTRKVRRTVTGH